MALKEHLIVHLQEQFATEKGKAQYLGEWSARISDSQLKSVVQGEIADIAWELDGLKQCLAVFGEFPQDLPSPFVMAFRQEDQVTQQTLSHELPADLDVHLALNELGFGNLEIGFCQGMLNMAQALNEQEVVNQLQQIIAREQHGLNTVRSLLPRLITQSSQWPAA